MTSVGMITIFLLIITAFIWLEIAITLRDIFDLLDHEFGSARIEEVKDDGPQFDIPKEHKKEMKGFDKAFRLSIMRHIKEDK